jgi:DNA-binding transcriptional MerR regulator
VVAVTEGDSDDRTWTISEISSEFGVTPRTLRYYEELGLLSPERSQDNGQRLYTRRDRARLKLVLRGRRFGFSLKDLKELLDLYDTDPTRKEQIRRTLEVGAKRIEEIDEMIRELQVHRQELLDYRDRLMRFLEGKATAEELDLPLNDTE